MIKFQSNNFEQSPLRVVLNLFPDDEKAIMGTLDDLHNRVRELPGLTPLSHTFILCLLAKQYNQKGMNILEVGTNRGRTSFLLATVAPKAHVTTIDIDKGNWLFTKELHENGKAYSELKVTPVDTTVLFGNSAEYLKSYRTPSRSFPNSYASALLSQKFAKLLTEMNPALAVKLKIAE